MDFLFTNRLYNLSINNFYNYSFFYFFLFSLQKNYYFLLQKENLKISYFSSKHDFSFINKKNKVYIVYNYFKSEIFSLPKLFYLFNNQNNDLNLNVCLSYNSILYTNYYYSSNIRSYYIHINTFLKKNILFFTKHLKMFSLFNTFFLNNYNLFNKIINISIYRIFFANRFKKII